MNSCWIVFIGSWLNLLLFLSYNCEETVVVFEVLLRRCFPLHSKIKVFFLLSLFDMFLEPIRLIASFRRWFSYLRLQLIAVELLSMPRFECVATIFHLGSKELKLILLSFLIKLFESMANALIDTLHCCFNYLGCRVFEGYIGGPVFYVAHCLWGRLEGWFWSFFCGTSTCNWEIKDILFSLFVIFPGNCVTTAAKFQSQSDLVFFVLFKTLRWDFVLVCLGSTASCRCDFVAERKCLDSFVFFAAITLHIL